MDRRGFLGVVGAFLATPLRSVAKALAKPALTAVDKVDIYSADFGPVMFGQHRDFIICDDLVTVAAPGAEAIERTNAYWQSIIEMAKEHEGVVLWGSTPTQRPDLFARFAEIYNGDGTFTDDPDEDEESDDDFDEELALSQHLHPGYDVAGELRHHRRSAGGCGRDLQGVGVAQGG